MAEVVITDQNFDAQVLKATIPVLVDFWAEWCGPCRMQNPILEQLAHEYEGKVVIGKMNVDEQPNVPQQFGIMSIPTMMIFKGGQPVQQFIGVQSKETLSKAFQSLL